VSRKLVSIFSRNIGIKNNTKGCLMKGKVTCGLCDTENYNKNKYCNECGSKLQIYCIKCKSLQPVWANFCGECKFQLQPVNEKAQEKTVEIMTLEEAETLLIKAALKKCQGVQTQAAKLIGISERAMRYKMKVKGIENPII
jgi:DNA-binding NtrC family response regulator